MGDQASGGPDGAATLQPVADDASPIARPRRESERRAPAEREDRTPVPALDAPPLPGPFGRINSSSRWNLAHRALLLSMDALTLVAAVSVGAAVDGLQSQALLGLLLVPLWIIGLAATGGYDLRHSGSGTPELARVVGASLRVALGVIALAYLARSDDARGLVFVSLPLGTALLLVGRITARGITGAARRRGHGQHRVLVVGTVVDVLDLVEQAARTPSAGFRVVGACVPLYDGPERRVRNNRRYSSTGATHDQKDGDRRAESDRRADIEHLITVGVPVVGQPHQAYDAAARCAADTVVVAGQGVLSRHALRRMAWHFEGTGVEIYFASSLSDVATPRITLRPLGRLPLMHVEAPVFEGAQRLVKSTTDRALAALLTVVASPALLAIALLIRLDSPGPALYRQQRIGVGGQAFSCLKFRTMRVGADRELANLDSESDGVLFKIRADPRVTRVGKVLRRYSLDELPQLINVLGGSMSLVGPRPPLLTEAAQYGHDVQRRLLVKPGMTGLWQVSGRSDLSWAESVRLDLYYVENWSPFFDLQLMARTVVAVTAGRGAY